VAKTQSQLDHRIGESRVTPDKWAAVRAALQNVTDRFGELVLAADPAAMATADWTVMETAAHVTGIASHYTSAVNSGHTSGPVPGVDEQVLSTTVYNIHEGMNAAILRGYTERDPQQVVERLRTSVGEVLKLSADADPTRIVTWLGGARLPLAGMLAHLTNELLLHGYDIARTSRVRWDIPSADAALFFELFLVEILRNGVGVLLDDDAPVRPGRIAVEFRSAYTRPVTFVLDNGNVSIEEPSRDNEVRVYFEPATMNLVLFHYVTRTQAALTGKLVVWGRRPWLLAPFLRTVRLP
jgi:uncharacterized protein (TIGR03083 family)